jgi:hypothetical protein
MHDDASVAAVDMTLPLSFCWTRFGTEAGETINEILARKETERQANDGVFFWGIGNSIAPAVEELLRRVDAPEVLFSPIKSRPRRVDVAPDNVVRWTAAQGLTGDVFDLPSLATVTSRWDPSRGAAAHYALVCRSTEPLEITNTARVDVAALRNLRSGAPIGASQVTAIVARAPAHHDDGGYPVAFRATLVAPYFVRLRQPVTLDGRQHQPLPFVQLTLR